MNLSTARWIGSNLDGEDFQTSREIPPHDENKQGDLLWITRFNFRRRLYEYPAKLSHGINYPELGMPDYAMVLRQHKAYCQALRQCGLEVITLEADLAHPDATFVEDVAILTLAALS